MDRDAIPVSELPLYVRRLGLQDYQEVWQAMHKFTDKRDTQTPDELWLLQHLPVFTLGQAGKREHVLAQGNIPVLKSDRGGQVTYHGPGQLVAYVLVDLRRRNLGVRELVSRLERTVVSSLASFGIEAYARLDAPGVYVDLSNTTSGMEKSEKEPTKISKAGEAKVASLGLRVRKGCSFHGLAVNVAMDLEPFYRINPCGYPGMAVTQVADLVKNQDSPIVEAASVESVSVETVGECIKREFIKQMAYSSYLDSPPPLGE